VAATYSLDGGAFTPYAGPFSVSGTGVHVVAFQGSDGSSGSVAVPIDVTAPKVIVPTTTGTVEVGQTSTDGIFTCADAGSGIASCTSTALNTSSITTTTLRSITVTATDRVDNSFGPVTVFYRVLYPFRGFFDPIINLPYLNRASAGLGVPVKFSLRGNRGLTIFASGYPLSQKINCDSTEPTNNVPTVTAGSSSLSYDSKTDTYAYTWKTDKAWAGTCRQLVVKLADGNVKAANFKFK
jgi:hypothetical protein